VGQWASLLAPIRKQHREKLVGMEIERLRRPFEEALPEAKIPARRRTL
jgi:hypothetical protein